MTVRRTRPAGKKVARTSPQTAPDAGTPTDPPVVDANAAQTTSAPQDIPDSGPPASDVDVPTKDGPKGNPGRDQVDKEDRENKDSQFHEFWQKYCQDHHTGLPKGRVLFPGEPMMVREGDEQRDSVVVVGEDVYRMVIPYRAVRPTFTLVARAGFVFRADAFLSQVDYDATIAELLSDLVQDDSQGNNEGSDTDVVR